MEKEFVPYKQALELKELGFIQPCFGYYTGDKKHLQLRPNMGRMNEPSDDVPTAPTFSQVFKWFSNVYNLFPEIYTTTVGGYVEFTFQIRDLYSEKYIYDNFVTNTGGYSGTFHTIEDTEISCLDKLIEIVKNK